MTTPIRWGILGAAKFAREHMAPAIHMAKGAELAALATSNPAKAAPFLEIAPHMRVHDSYDALLADPEIDAIYIPLPNHLHVEWTLKAIAAGKHVLCEKPMTMRASDFDALIAARDASGLVVTEAYMIVHHPQWRRARELFRDGAIGRLIQVDGVFSYDNSGDPGNIRNIPETGGGCLPDIGVYTCGSTRWVTGEEPEAVAAEIAWENGVDVTAHVTARFPSFRFQATTSMRMHPRQEMTFHGTDGILRLTAPFNARLFGEARVELHRNSHNGRASASVTTERFTKENHYEFQVEAFGRAIRAGEPLGWTLEDARGTQAMLDMAFAAAGRG
jgi:predicted dehydrogenase